MLRPPVASKAAGLAWDSKVSGQKLGQTLPTQNGSTTTIDSIHRESFSGDSISRKDSTTSTEGLVTSISRNSRPRTPDLISSQDTQSPDVQQHQGGNSQSLQSSNKNLIDTTSTSLPSAALQKPTSNTSSNSSTKSPSQQKPAIEPLSYRSEYPHTAPNSRMVAEYSARVTNSANTSNLPSRQRSPQRRNRPQVPDYTSRPRAGNTSSPRTYQQSPDESGKSTSSDGIDENPKLEPKSVKSARKANRKGRDESESVSENTETAAELKPKNEWEARVQFVKKHLPKGVDEHAAKQIFNEIVVSGDEVHWEDVAGLDVAKKALKEAVVYPFLRPDLFMGLREPARGMLLFGPPGTGKTMLARAVATESKSTFFAISASSLTSKWLGESEKLVRALFSLAKALAPSIIFVDEIDSLLSSRGGSSEHESTRRIKTEFLIQWSDLQKAAAGKAQSDKDKQEGDASRVLVLAATNMPWAIDEAARRRFVRRQYIPLPESHVRDSQLRTLLSHQKHNLKKNDIEVLVELTDGKMHQQTEFSSG